MINKIIRPGKDGKGVYKNTGSCAPLVNYLSKEDKKLGNEREYFFDHDNDMVLASQVEKTIDSLRKGLGKNDTKFYSLVIAPTEEEINCMKDPKKEIRDYTRKCMDLYARNFNGLKKEKNLEGKDIAYFAKIEFNRYYKGTDEEVKNRLVKQGDKKPGNNLHVHIVVARKDKSNTHKISPLVKNKGLFHIEGFKLKTCYLHDETYKREGAAIELERMMIKRDGNDLAVKQYETFKPKLDIESIKDISKNDKSTDTSISQQSIVGVADIIDIITTQFESNIGGESQIIEEDSKKQKKKKEEERNRKSGFRH